MVGEEEPAPSSHEMNSGAALRPGRLRKKQFRVAYVNFF